jgi:hypothetical protein
MKKSIFLTIVISMCFSSLFAQSLDSYKYVLVPDNYEFQRSPDQYQVNSLVKFLFNRAGYTAFLVSDELPEDLKNDNCLAANAIVEVIPSMLSVKTVVRLEDCFGKTILVTKEARSKEKNYQKAYHESIRKTFVDIEELTYNYSPNENKTVVAENSVKPKKIVVEEKIFEHLPIKKEITKKEKETQLKLVSEVKKELPKKVEKSKKEVKNKKKKKLGEPEEKIEMIKIKPAIFNLAGIYDVEGWGKSEIVKNDDEYIFKGGDENFEFASIYETSKPNIYIIKWVAFKQPQLLEIDSNGTLRVDSANGVKYFKRVH